jgi:hypothetical protein
MNQETPEKYLDKHPLTQYLRQLGISDQQFCTMRFSPNNTGRPFSQWSYRCSADVPDSVVNLLKPYIALKSLVFETLVDPRDKEDAELLVATIMSAPVFEMGMRTKENNRIKARKSRGKITEDGKNIEQVIGELTHNPEYRDEPAKELWPRFFAKLGELGLDPEDQDKSGDSERWAYRYYDFRGNRKRLGFGRFANIVSRCRRNK